jgi:hypothetical protein
LLFEISFLFLLLGRRLRYVAALLGLGFHSMTEMVMNIQFESLRNCYVIFVSWGRIGKRLRALTGLRRAAGNPRISPEPRVAATAALGGLLVAGNIWAGATRAVDGWPLACYPPFEGLAEDYLRTLHIQATMADGSERSIEADDYRDTFGNRWNNLLQRILQLRDPQQRNRQLELVWNVLAQESAWARNARRVRFVSTRTFVDPSRWGEAPDDPQVLLDIPIDPGREGPR